MIVIGPPKPDPTLVILIAEKLGVSPAVSITIAPEAICLTLTDFNAV